MASPCAPGLVRPGGTHRPEIIPCCGSQLARARLRRHIRSRTVKSPSSSPAPQRLSSLHLMTPNSSLALLSHIVIAWFSARTRFTPAQKPLPRARRTFKPSVADLSSQAGCSPTSTEQPSTSLLSYLLPTP